MQADYRAAAQVLDNDGHTLRVRLKNAGALQLGSTRFTLTQFHFHTPGGETLDGEAFPFSAHVLHRGPGGGLLALTDAPCTEGWTGWCCVNRKPCRPRNWRSGKSCSPTICVRRSR